ncbi:conserved hypothetical protein [Ricinus communis]|uniref:Uncharacterized protein n=1 Tax=Ricinus communis TaxID=3988 RepID=B9RPS3_RICCO|nr:conserved hypothetical protein [Ricinus communis]
MEEHIKLKESSNPVSIKRKIEPLNMEIKSDGPLGKDSAPPIERDDRTRKKAKTRIED